MSKKRRRCKKGMRVQSVLISKKRGKKKAKRWLKKHGYLLALDVGKTVYRARQSDPKNFTDFRVIEFKPGIKAVIGCPK